MITFQVTLTTFFRYYRTTYTTTTDATADSMVDGWQSTDGRRGGVTKHVNDKRGCCRLGPVTSMILFSPTQYISASASAFLFFIFLCVHMIILSWHEPYSHGMILKRSKRLKRWTTSGGLFHVLHVDMAISFRFLILSVLWTNYFIFLKPVLPATLSSCFTT